MYPFGGILIAPLVAAYLASVICRLARRRNKRPSWLVAPLAIAFGIFAVWAATIQADFFRPSVWEAGKAPMWAIMLLSGAPALVLGTATTIPVVFHHRDKYEKDKRMA